MTSNLDTSPGPAERARTRRFATHFGVAFLAYVLVLIASLTWGDWEGTSPWRLLWVLAPALPIVALAVVLIRYVSTSDEMEVILTCKSLAVAFAVTMLSAVVIGLLDIADFRIPGAGWWLYSIGMATWLVARIALSVTGAKR